jgi:cytochrome P450
MFTSFIELLRKYPTTQLTDRFCVKNFKIPDTDIVIEEGTTVLIPIYPFQRDPDYFPHPERFDPERFNEENKKEIKPFTYIPFGTGPRNCIGKIHVFQLHTQFLTWYLYFRYALCLT